MSCPIFPIAKSDRAERVPVSVGHVGVLNDLSIGIQGLIATGVSPCIGPRGRVRTNLILFPGSNVSDAPVAEIG